MHTTSVADPKNSYLAWSEEEQEKATNIVIQAVLEATMMNGWHTLRHDLERKLCEQFGYGAFAFTVPRHPDSVCVRHPKKPETLIISYRP